MDYYRWKDIKEARTMTPEDRKKRLDSEIKAELDGFDRLYNSICPTHKHPSMPTGMRIVSEVSGFRIVSSPHGECFEWYRFSRGKWKTSHILFGENWLLKEPVNFLARFSPEQMEVIELSSDGHEISGGSD